MVAAAPGVSGHAAAGLRAPRPPVRAAAQQEAGRHRAEVEVGEVRAGAGAEIEEYNIICLGVYPWIVQGSPNVK